MRVRSEALAGKVAIPVDVSRRTFLKSAGAMGGLVIGFTALGGRARAAADSGAAQDGFAPNAFVHVDTDDTVTVLLAHSEMGQGIWTTLPLLVAEELDADWDKVRVEHAPAAPAYFHPSIPVQMTGGSTTTWSEFERYRRAGATARAMLLEAAARSTGMPLSQLRTEAGAVVAGDRRLRYGELAEAAAKLTPPDPQQLRLKSADAWTLIGRSAPRLDNAEKIAGRARFGIDVQFEGLLTAVVARAPVFGATVKQFDADAARAIAGVRHVVEVPSGVAVVADHYWPAKLGRDALRIEWDLGPNAGLDSERLAEEFAALARQQGLTAAEAGDPEGALVDAATTVEAEYRVPYLAHAPMEPLNCTVKIDADGCEIWTGTQAQTMDQQTAAEILGLRPEQVRLHTVFLGGAFGRRGTPSSDFVREAVHVAKAVGAPVKTMWTREDDIRGGYYRPGFVHRATVGLDAAGKPVAWKQTIVGQSIAAGTSMEAMMIRDGVDLGSVEGVADSPYLTHIPAYHVGLHSPRPGIPVLWWRSVGHSHTAFAMESLVDELAHAAGQNPLGYRHRLLADHPRHLRVLNLAAEKFGWGEPAEGRAHGLAVHESFRSVVAQAVEVSVDRGRIRVHRVVCAVDCGLCVNPDGVAAQMESGIVFGLSAALFGKLTLSEGRVQESNFHDYPVLRQSEMPKIEVHIVQSDAEMGGAGEPGTPPIAPAVANAVFALTGQRLRQLPLRLPAAAPAQA